MSNFTLLKANWPDLYATVREAEQNVNSAPRTSWFCTSRSLEIVVKWLYVNDSYLKKPYADRPDPRASTPLSPPIPRPIAG